MKAFEITTSEEAKRGFYPTPEPLAEKLVAGIRWCEIETVLEPSAGKGDLIKQIGRYYSMNEFDSSIHVDSIEIDPVLRTRLDYEFQGRREDEIREQLEHFRELKSYDSVLGKCRELTEETA